MLEDLIRSVGTDSFSPAAFSFLRDKLEIQHLTIARFAQYRPIKFFAVECAVGENIFRPAVYRYMRTFYLGDPFRAHYHASRKCEHLVFSVSADQVDDPKVREELYRPLGLAGKLALIIRRHQDVLTLTVHRSSNVGCFSNRDVNIMRNFSSMLAAMVERHVSIVDPPVLNNLSQISELVTEIPASSRLSKQEVAVCAHAITGHSTESIALNLGISTHSIVTYRRRAYAKLNISSQNELFLLLLGRCTRRPVVKLS
jgi:DNA-binding CsgD family transcriptional regulator